MLKTENFPSSQEFKNDPQLSLIANHLQNQNGQSLVQALISMGIMGVLLAIFMTVSMDQNRQIQGIQEKLARSDFQQQFTRSFSDGTLCSMLLMNVTFSAPGGHLTSSSPGSIDLTFPGTPPSIPVSTATGAPLLASATKPVSLLSNTLMVGVTNPFSLTNIIGSSSGPTGTFTANFQVNFDNSKLIQSLGPASVQVIISTTSSGDTQTISGCTAVTAKTFRCIDVFQPMPPSCGANPANCSITAQCPVGYQLTSCWNEEDGGSMMEISRNVAPSGQDQCICSSISTTDYCWSVRATCCQYQ